MALCELHYQFNGGSDSSVCMESCYGTGHR